MTITCSIVRSIVWCPFFVLLTSSYSVFHDHSMYYLPAVVIIAAASLGMLPKHQGDSRLLNLPHMPPHLCVLQVICPIQFGELRPWCVSFNREKGWAKDTRSNLICCSFSILLLPIWIEIERHPKRRKTL